MHDPEQWALRLLPIRSFIEAKAAWDNAKTGDEAHELLKDPWIRKARDIEMECAELEIAALTAEEDEE
jgi:hypothetical protein